MKQLRLSLLGLALFGAAGAASDLEDLARQGYAVVLETEVDGEFEGCEHGRRIRFTNGLIFECNEYSYNYAYNPDVLILQHVRSGDIRVIIDHDEYEGTLYERS